MSETVVDSEVADDDGRRRVAPFISLAVAVVVGLLFIALVRSDPARDRTIDSFLTGQPAPSVISTTLEGESFDLSRRKGSWVVLNFFDPTCVPCINEHPQLVAFDEQQSALPDGAELYTIVNQGSDDSVRAFFDDRGGSWPVVRDPDGSISVAFGVSQVPETWIIDPNGIIRQRIAGEITAVGLAELLQQFREALG